MKSIEGHLKVHAEALALRSQRNEILASNIANAATPNFKAKDLDFEEKTQNDSFESIPYQDYVEITDFKP